MIKVAVLFQNHINDAMYLLNINPELACIHALVAEELLTNYDMDDLLENGALIDHAIERKVGDTIISLYGDCTVSSSDVRKFIDEIIYMAAHLGVEVNTPFPAQ